MWLFLAGLLLQLAGGVGAILAARKSSFAHAAGAGSAVLGCVAVLASALPVLLGTGELAIRIPWTIPFGAFAVGIDPLSALFLVATAVVGMASALYGVSYLGEEPGSRVAVSWAFFNTLLAAMALVITARNAVLFLLAWEAMSIASFFLVTFDHQREEVRSAGWLYLIASHLGAAVLIALFVVLGRGAASLDFDAFPAAASASGLASVVFVLALVGFGVKAGFIPVHVWLPEAHPAAPSHVSALMSGVMIKTGIYGIVRTLTWLGPPRAWWGWTLVGVGITSGVLGVLFALAQHDLKRLLAYHSVENIGIIALGLGLGVLGVASGNNALAAAGFAGGLLHVVNHALFKSLLFMAAGAVIHATGTRHLEHLGGLMRRMRWTGVAFLIGSVAIVGLPPLNGFVSELLIYVGALQSAQSGAGAPSGLLLGCAAALALIGGLAAACFTKAFGVVFLGVERRPLAGEHLSDPPAMMRLAMALLAVACVAIGLFAPTVLRAMVSVLAQVSSLGPALARESLLAHSAMFTTVTRVSAAGFGLVLALWLLRHSLLRRHPAALSPTWDCGYVAPSSRMQYTASSFAQPLLDLFGALVRSSRDEHLPQGPFPKDASFATHEHDVWKEQVFAGAFRRGAAILDRFHWIQQGNVQLYVLYIVVTLVALLLWKLY